MSSLCMHTVDSCSDVKIGGLVKQGLLSILEKHIRVNDDLSDVTEAALLQKYLQCYKSNA